MKLNAVAVSSKNIEKTVSFYKLLGFEFPELKKDEQHIESIQPKNEPKLMIDSAKLMKDILGYEPNPSNHSSFAVEYESSEKVDEISKKIKENGFKIFKEAWDAEWGQRYCIVQDPDGYMVDLYSNL